MRALRALAIGLGLVVALSACEMTVRFTTVLNERGGGTFTLGMLLDQNVREGLDLLAEFTGDPADGLESIVELFDGLEEAGWIVNRTEPNGGLALEATSHFVDPADFGRVLTDLGSARRSGGGTLGGTALELGVDASETFLRTNVGFDGLVDLTLPEDLFGDEQAAILAQLRAGLRFEVRTEYPGAIGEVEGEAVTNDGVVVWRPQLGERTEFAATSSALRVANLLVVLLPALLALGALAWWLIARRGRRDDEGLQAIRPDVSM